MANSSSAKKRIRQNEKARLRNRAGRSKLRTSMKVFVTAEESGENIEAALKDIVRELDKASSKGLIHKRTADRNKSRITKRANKALAASS